jgi:hypothetical protein
VHVLQSSLARAKEALESYRRSYPDIWNLCYPEEHEEEPEPGEPQTAEDYVEHILRDDPDADPELLTKTVAEIYGVNEHYARGLVDRILGKRRGRRPQDFYRARV